jgi:hypothetical protein
MKPLWTKKKLFRDDVFNTVASLAVKEFEVRWQRGLLLLLLLLLVILEWMVGCTA